MGCDRRVSRQRRHTWVRAIALSAERPVILGHANSQMCRKISEGNRDIGVFSFCAVEASRIASARDSLSLSPSSISWNTVNQVRSA